MCGVAVFVAFNTTFCITLRMRQTWYPACVLSEIFGDQQNIMTLLCETHTYILYYTVDNELIVIH